MVDIFPSRAYFYRCAEAFLTCEYSLVRHIPAWFPGAYFRRLGQEATALGIRARFWAFGMVEESMVNLHFTHFITF